MAEERWRTCPFCKIPIASDDCRHIDHIDGRVVMSQAEHDRLVGELTRLRNQEED